MVCGGGAQTVSPAESDPLGFSVDAKTGAITGTPQVARDGYRMRLQAVDAGDNVTTIANWTFNVKQTPKFSLRPEAEETDGRLKSKYHVAETHLLPKPNLAKEDLLQYPASGDYGKVVFLLSAEIINNHSDPRFATGGDPDCSATGGGQTRAISALTDVATGEGAISIQCVGSYAATLVVRDGDGDEVTVRNWTFEVLPPDVSVPAYGPSGRRCANGKPVDGKSADASMAFLMSVYRNS